MSLQPKRFYAFNSFRLDPQQHLLLRAGEPVPLTPKAFATLLCLVQNSGRVIKKEELMQAVWPDAFVEEVGLARNISVLRKALGEGENGHRYIVTAPGQGYSFVAEVKELEEGSPEPTAHSESGSSYVIEEEQNLGKQDEVPALACATSSAEYILSEIKRHRRRALLALTILIAAVVGVAFLYKLSKRKTFAPSVLKVTQLTTTGKAYGPAISPDGKYVAYHTPGAGGSRLWIRQLATGSNAEVIPLTKTSYQGLTFSPDGNYLYYAGNKADEHELALYQIPAPLGGVTRKLVNNVDNLFSLSPDSPRVTFVRDERDLIVANLDGSGERKLATREKPDFFESAAWSPDGKMIACFGWSKGPEWEIVEVAVESGAQKTVTRNWGNIQQVAWLPDGSGLVLLAADKQDSPTQLWQLTYPNGEVRRITTDLHDYASLSLTRDGAALVMTQMSLTYNLWVMPQGDAQRAHQITSASVFEGLSGLAWTPTGKIIYSSQASGQPEIWRVDADGSHQQQLTVDLGSDSLGLAASPDGRYIAFVSKRGGIWRANIDGSNPKQLASEGFVPIFSPDSQWVYYRAHEAVWQVSVDGGESIHLTGPCSFILDFSSDGKLIAYRDQATKKIGIASAEGKEPIRIFERMPTTERRPLPRWTPDGHALSYLTTRGGVSNLWLQPIDGSPPRPLTDFKTGFIHYYAWSRDGKYLAVARGSTSTDVVMISNFR